MKSYSVWNYCSVQTFKQSDGVSHHKYQLLIFKKPYCPAAINYSEAINSSKRNGYSPYFLTIKNNRSAEHTPKKQQQQQQRIKEYIKMVDPTRPEDI